MAWFMVWMGVVLLIYSYRGWAKANKTGELLFWLMQISGWFFVILYALGAT